MPAFTAYIKYFRYETQKHSAHDYTLGTQTCGQFSRNKQKIKKKIWFDLLQLIIERIMPMARMH